jgi:hypothetical protein
MRSTIYLNKTQIWGIYGYLLCCILLCIYLCYIPIIYMLQNSTKTITINLSAT